MTGYNSKFTGEEIDALLTLVEEGDLDIPIDTELSEKSNNPIANSAVTKALANKVDKVEGKGLSTNDYADEDKSQVESMYSIIYEAIDIDLSTSKNGIIDVYRNEYLNISGFKYIEIPILSGKKVSYAGRNGGSSMAMIIVKDANDDIIRIVDQGDGSYTERTGTIRIADKNAEKIVFTYRNDSASPYLRIDNPIDISKLPQAVDAANDYMEFKETFIKAKSPNLWDGSTIDKVISTSGDLVVVPSWTENKSSDLIPILPNAYYYLSGRTSRMGTLAIRCIDAQGTAIKVLAPATSVPYDANWWMPNVDGSGTAANGMFKTPSNADYVQFVLSTQAGTPYNGVMLEYVGMEYDVNFKPSSYQPYDPTEIINPDKLPDNMPNANADKAVSRKYPLRVLLIGSSHGMNSISQVPWICYKSGFNVTIGNVYKGSLTLQQVATAIESNTSIGGWFKVFSNGKWVTSDTTIFDDVIRYADWDYIIVQRSASDDNLWNAEQSNALTTIISRINDVATNTPSILFNSGFADPSSDATAQKAITQTIMTTAMNMQIEHQIEVIPVATAIQNARGTLLGNIGAYAHKDMCYDSQHLDYGIGCYVASATIVQHILSKYGWDILTMKGYGTYEESKSFVNTLVDTGGEGVAYTEPTSETIRIAKLCAKAAFLKPMEVNERLAELFPRVQL